MKAKRVTVKDLVLQQVKFGVRKPAQMHKALNGQANRQHVYAILAKLKKEGVIVTTPNGYYMASDLPLNNKKLTPVNKTKRKYTKRTDYYKSVNGAQVLISKDVEKLQAEVFKLNDWCIQWNNKVKEAQRTMDAQAQEEISRLKYMVCDKDAVIAYLEDKLVQMLK